MKVSITMQNKKHVSDTVFFCLGILLIALFFQAGGFLKGNKIVYPDLSEIMKALFRLLSEGSTYTKIFITLKHVAEALLFSVFIGVFIGIAEGLSRAVYSFFRPLMILIRSMPMIVLVILMMSAISYQTVPFASTGIILIPVFSEAVYAGCRSIDPELIDVYKINGGLSPGVFIHVYLPLISGYLRQAFINAAGMGIKVAVSAEYLVQTRNSLGKAIYSSGYFSDFAEIYAYAVIMIFLVLAITELPCFIFTAKSKKKEI